MKRYISILGIFFFFYYCAGLQKNAVKKYPDSVLVIGESVETKNDFTNLKDSLNEWGRGNCKEESESGSNYLVCEKSSGELLIKFREASQSDLKKEEDKIWKINNQNEISKISKNYNDAMRLVKEGKFKDALNILKSNSFSKSKQFRAMQTEMEEKLNTPEYKTNEALSVFENFKYNEELSALENLKESLSKKPELTSNEDLKKRVQTLLEKLNSRIVCNIRVIESVGPVYANTGFDDPLSGTLHCDGLKSNVKYQLLIHGDKEIRFGSSFDLSHEIYFSENSEFSFPVSSLNMTREDNKLSFEVITFSKDTLQTLEQFGSKSQFTALVTPASYEIQNVPAFFNSGYSDFFFQIFSRNAGSNSSGKRDGG